MYWWCPWERASYSEIQQLVDVFGRESKNTEEFLYNIRESPEDLVEGFEKLRISEGLDHQRRHRAIGE